jgi:multiple sugar transport system ATP-binding protein
MNFLKTADTDIKNKKLTVNIGDLTLDLDVDVSSAKAGDEIDIGIRPEDLVVSSSKGGIPMSVEVVEHIGATVILYGSVLGNSNFCAVLPSDSIIKPGETVNLVFDSSKCHAFNSAGQALKKTYKKK